jgi:hypothetical protein
MPNVVPVEIANAGHTRILIDAVKETVSELKSDVKELRNNRHTDFLWHIGVLCAGFLLLAGLILHLYARIDDKIQNLSTSSTRMETKLEGMIQRSTNDGAQSPKK